jgi:1-acyl-sn-glycerol-3-phosphate acyltransferase
LESSRASRATGALRFLRLTLHFVQGLATVVLLFPLWSPARRAREVRRWSRKLLSLVALRWHCRNLPRPMPRNCLLVLNHVSWLDIFLVDAVRPATFVAKSEIGEWPLVGTLVSRVGTLYIERGSRSAARRTNERIAGALAGGALIACFPEGTTTHGHSVGRFHGALFQPAIDAGATIQPVALRYRDAAGRLCEACAYVGDDSLVKSVWNIVSTRAIVAEMDFLPPLQARGWERRALAQRVQSEIGAALASSAEPPRGMAPGTASDPLAAPR